MDNIPPQNLDAETSVLGSVLLDHEVLPAVIEILSPVDFYRQAHTDIFQSMLDLYNNREPVDLITLIERLKKQELLDNVGGVSYIAGLANLVPTTANVEYYAKIVKEKSLARQVILNANKILHTAYSEDFETAEELINFAESSMFQIGQKNVKGTLVPVKDVLYKQIDVIEARDASKGVTGISTTFKPLDYYTAGLQPADLIIIAARPSMGKTSLALQMAMDGSIKNGIKSAIFSLEVSRAALAEKMLVNKSMVDGQRIRLGKLNDEDWKKISFALTMITNADIFIDDTPDITVPDMRSKCRKLKVEKGLDLIVVDYLQLMNCHKKVKDRQQEISEISRALKLLARELNIPVITLSQLNRAVESRQDKHPIMSDLRESGSLEQDADLVMFLYRDDYYKLDSEKKGITEIIIGKQRSGPTGTIELGFIKECTRFTMLDTFHKAAGMGHEVKGGQWPGDRD